MSASILRFIPFLIPVLLLQLGLMIAALVHIMQHEHYRVGNRVAWILIVVLVNLIGPILYFILGRSDD